MKGSVCSLLVLVITSVLLTASPGDSSTEAPVRNFNAVLGQSVTLRCPGNLSVHIFRLYLQMQRGQTDYFINGFDTARSLPVTEYMNRTEVNQTDLSVTMSNITVSDEGQYKCIVFYTEMPNEEHVINLKVTAMYSVPTLMAECIHVNGPATGGKSCQLSCSSTGGYPWSEVEWPGLHPSESDNETESFQDPHSKTWTINQTVTYYCDHPTNVSCSIGRTVSHTITICEADSFPLRVNIAIAFVVTFVLFLVLVLVLMKCHCRRPRPNPEDPALGVPLALRRAEP
ncbi:T-lymphocyte activation antigen CD80-like isoform X2 [Myxocyprinus asiaticus]|uniref:T-lymphocyte activation antigen CD80-like isoform X2 n=1 Tax=Myxocyprinus asiaticus TaxID=70543 RepID=UPI00222148F8|nr:T-lymphocyte activation antigen CD80-like isoform X2 [Myxocyprinus asiaticus]